MRRLSFFSPLTDRGLITCAHGRADIETFFPFFPLFSFLQRRRAFSMSWVRYWNLTSQGCCTISTGSSATRLSESVPYCSLCYIILTLSPLFQFQFLLCTVWSCLLRRSCDTCRLLTGREVKQHYKPRAWMASTFIDGIHMLPG